MYCISGNFRVCFIFANLRNAKNNYLHTYGVGAHVRTQNQETQNPSIISKREILLPQN